MMANLDPLICNFNASGSVNLGNESKGQFRFSSFKMTEGDSILKFGNLRKENSCLCYLSFEEGKDYSEALKTYQKKYGAQIAKRDAIEKLWKKYEFDLIKNKIFIKKKTASRRFLHS